MKQIETTKKPVVNPTAQRVFSKRHQRIISSAVILGMLNTVTLPVQAAIQQNQHEQQANQVATHQSSWEQLTELTAQHRLMVSGLKIGLGRSIHKAAWYETAWNKVVSLFTDDSETIAAREDALNTVDQVLALRLKTMQEQTVIMQEIVSQANLLKSQHVSPEIMQRQADMVKQLDSRFQTLQGLFDQLQQAKQSGNAERQQQALSTLDQQIQAWQPQPQQQDRQQLPWGSPDSKVREPITAENNNQQGQFKPASYHLGQTDLNTSTAQQHLSTATQQTSIGQWRNTEYQYAQYLQKQQLIRPINNTLSGMTASGTWPVLKSLPATVQDADLQANEDVSISPEIQALAKQLNYNPAKIYKWVYDNIEYVPTYGSIQGAAYTLETKRGNAFDTSSLLIALLRTSKVPARYVYGTIEVPANTVKDWVGGVNSVDAAQNLMGQGGIPNIGLVSGSQVTHVRMEHVWVEAAVDTLPSKGSLNRLDQDANVINPDAAHQWIPLDASYKRYNRTAGVDLKTAVPFNAEQLINDIKAGATIDESNGSVQNVDQSKINTAITAYNDQVKSYLEQNHPNATVGDILGKSEIRPYQSKMLSPVLPYIVNTVIADYQTLPDAMRHYFHLNTFPSNDPYAQMEGISDFSIKIPSTQLQGKPLAFSFRPSTQADIDLLASYLPKPDASGNIAPNQLPKSLPSSIRMTAEVTLGGQVLKVGQSYPLGTEIKAKMGFISPNNKWGLPNKQFQAGEYHAIGYDMQGLSKAQMERNKAQLEATKAKVEIKDEAQIKTLTSHDVTGAMLQAVVQSYFALNDTQDDIAGSQANITKNPYMSFGTFSTNVQGVYSWGVLRQAKLTGMMMDIDRISATSVDNDNNSQNWVNFNASQGARMSANEHLVPEQFFNDQNITTKNVNGVSAIKALQMGASQGQKIYTIDNNNISTVLPRISHGSDIIQDIQNAVAAGKVVTISQTKVTVSGWSGSGYIIFDPTTGAGAYMIGGGADGSSFNSDYSLLIANLALAFSDTASDVPGGRPWFSDALKAKWVLSQISKVVGFVGLAASVFLVLINDSLSPIQKLAQVSTSLLSFGLISMAVGAIASATFIPLVLAIALSVFVALAISALTIYVNTTFFAHSTSRRSDDSKFIDAINLTEILV
jgi:transglutaminase-like putative cysteine protease